jgi:hypothetical protein
MKFRTDLLLICILMALISISGCNYKFERRQIFINENIEIADEIIVAIESYKQDNTEVPKTIDDLSPRYLLEIPTTTSKREFEYRVVSKTDYLLSFKVMRYKDMSCSYLTKFQDWECSFSSDHNWFP